MSSATAPGVPLILGFSQPLGEGAATGAAA